MLAQTFNSMTTQLQETFDHLEDVAVLGQQLNAALDLNKLLDQLVVQVKERFGYSYAQGLPCGSSAPAASVGCRSGRS